MLWVEGRKLGSRGMLLSRRDSILSLAATGALAAAPLTRAWAQPADPAAPDTPADEDPTQVGSARDRYQHVLAPVAINGDGPYQFLVDTGANTSCVSRRLADRLMLAAGPPAPVHTFVGVHTRPSVIIDHLQVGARSRKRVTAAALPISGEEIDGVLGVDWLNGQRLVLDFKNKDIAITRSQEETSSVDRVVVPARRKMGQLTIVDADLSGRRISAMIDSGSQVTICNTPLRRAVFEYEASHNFIHESQRIGLETLAGEPFSGEMLTLPFVRLGGLKLGNVSTVYADMHVFDLWGLKDQPALVLGMDLLTQFHAVSLDFGRSQVRFDIA
jgi:predicted aspartyl protease